MASQSAMKEKLTGLMSDDKLPTDDILMVRLRIRAHTRDLDVTWAKDTLGLSESDPAVKGVFAYKDEGLIGCEFGSGEKLSSDVEVEHWQRPVFRVATEWLRAKSKDQFQKLKEAGSRADLLVTDYEGYIPADLLKEIVRLEIDLLIIGKT